MLAEQFPIVEVGDRRGCLTFIEHAEPTRSCADRLRVECVCGRPFFVSQKRFLSTVDVSCGCNRPGPKLARVELPTTETDTAEDRRKREAKRRRGRGLARLKAIRGRA